MNVIYKYKLDISAGIQKICLPCSSYQVLSVEVIDSSLFVWIKLLKTDDSSKTKIFLEVLGTGEEADSDLRRTFIGTAVDREMNLVWHVFEIFEDDRDFDLTGIFLKL
jgi:hypothetical protein